MNDKIFIDTNILVYSFDHSAPEKKNHAQEIISRCLVNRSGIISFQVVQEFLNVASKKFVKPLSPEDCRKYLTAILAPLCEIFSSIELYQKALAIMARYQYSFYDSLIIGAALHANCTLLFSEDLQHDQQIESLKIQNPFQPLP